MMELLRLIQVLGVRRTVRLFRAHNQGWKKIISGFYTTRAMQALINVGFFDEIISNTSVNPEAFAQSRNLDKDIVRALCQYLYCLRILERNHSDYVLSHKGRLLVEESRGWFEATYGYEEVFHFLEDMVQRKKIYGKDIYRRPECVAKGGGRAQSLVYFPLAIQMITSYGAEKVLDLGCADGTFLEQLCKSDANVTGCGIDISEEAIADAKEKIHRAGLDNRIHLFAEDISKIEKLPDMLKDIDIATLFLVLHEILYEGSEAVIELLRNFKRLFPNVPLIIFEVVRPSLGQMRKRPGMTVQYMLHHDITHQKLVTIQEWEGLFKQSGFKSINTRYLGFVKSVIFTLK